MEGKRQDFDNPSNKETALVYGVLLGDGCLSKVEPNYYFVDVCCNIHDDIPFLKKIKPIFEKIRKNNINIKLRPSHGAANIVICHKKTFLFFKSLGFPVGVKGTTLKISNHFDKNLWKYIIKGYFACDGCLVLTNNNGTLYLRIEFSGISKIILQQVLDYLRELGMNGNIYVSHRYPEGSQRNTAYRIQFNGEKNLYLFRNKIGFVNPKHEGKLKFYECEVPEGGFELPTFT